MEMFLLGAGASRNAGVPLAFDMTSEILARMPVDSRHYRVLTFVIGGLLFRQGEAGKNPLSGQVNVEDLFNAVQLLAERNTLEAAPFVGSWHAGVQELDRRVENLRSERISRVIFEAIWKEIAATIPRGGDLDDFAVNNRVLELVRAVSQNWSSYTVGGYGSVGRSISEHIEKYLKRWAGNLRSRSSESSAVDNAMEAAINASREVDGEGEIFASTTRAMTALLRDLVWIEDSAKVEYLKPLASLGADQSRVVIATLNYDNSIELMAENAGISCNTGIDQWCEGQEITCAAEGLILLKLHGSIDWRFRDEIPEVGKRLETRVVEKVQADQVKTNHAPAVIFGQRNKLRADGPFLGILRAFGQELENAKRLNVIGYSFADQHVNEYITRWFNRDEQRRLRVVAPNFDKNSAAFARILRQQAGERLEVVNAKAEDALPELCNPKQMQLDSSL